MNSKVWIQKALTMCLLATIVATYSMVALANTGKVAGELTVIGGTGDTSIVTVNGEPATSGRTIFSASTISTPEGVRAVINLNQAGKLEIAPNTTFTINFDNNAIAGDLTTGSVRVLEATKSVGVRMLSGEVAQLEAGEAATASGKAAARDRRNSQGECVDTDNDGDKECDEGAGWLWFGVIFGGALAAIIWAATSDSDTRIGGGAGTVSPVR